MSARASRAGRAVVAGTALAWWTLGIAPSIAAVIPFAFDATLQTGPLAGTVFSGNAGYDNAGETGHGQEFLPLSTLFFTLDGVAFTRADISQGGQAILQNGTLSYFTAAFFPPPPDGSPVSDIAFGFGGPGIIGYVVTPNQFGSGIYTFTAAVPEPSPMAPLMLGLLAAVAPRLTACLRVAAGWRGRGRSGSRQAA